MTSNNNDSDIRISIVIVNYKVPECLKEALHSLRQADIYDKSEVIVVDNASNDNSEEIITKEFPEVQWIQLKSNIGFGKACNVGVRNACGEYLLILNPDTVVGTSTLADAYAFMKSHPEVGLLGPKILNQDGTLQASCRRSFPTPSVAFYHFSGLSKLFPKSRRFGRYNVTYMDPNESAEVDAVSGSFMFIPRNLFEKIDGFDKRFFMYGEDLDLCWRIREHGYKVWYFPTIEIIHRKGKSSARRQLHSRIAFYEAMILFSRKYHHTHGSFFPVWLIYIGIAIQATMNIGASLLRLSTAYVIDLFFINFILWAGITIRFSLGQSGTPYLQAYTPTLLLMHGLLSASFIFVFAYNGIYSEKRYSIPNAFFSGLIATVIFTSGIYFIKSVAFSRIAFALSSLAIMFVLVGWREVLPRAIRKIRRLIYAPDRVVIVGNGSVPAILVKNIEEKKSAVIIGVLCSPEHIPPGQYEGYPVLGTIEDIPRVLQQHKVDILIIATSVPWYSLVIKAISSSKAKNLTIQWVPRDILETEKGKLPNTIPLCDFL